MAKITSAVTFTGKVGGLIGYKRNGKYFLRSVPGKVRQSKATKRAAKRFGAASRKGALIRSALATELDILCDGAHVNQLNKTILHAGRDNHAGLTGFRFNKHKRVRDFFSTELEFTPDGILHIPAQQICAKEGAVRMEVKLIGTRIDFTTGKVTGSDASAMYIDLEGAFTPFTGADMSIEVPGKGTLLVTVRVRLFFESGLSLGRRNNAADIIAVLEEQPAETTSSKDKPNKAPAKEPVATTVRLQRNDNGQPYIQRE